MWNVEPELQSLLIDEIGYGPFEPEGLPDAVIRGVFSEPLWLMQGRVNQMWRSIADLGPKIRVAINAKPTVGARAIPLADYPVITINAGTCVRLRQLMHHAVYSREIFPARASEEDFPEVPLQQGLRLAPAGDILEPVDLTPGDSDEDHFRLAAPMAPTAERQKLANALTVVALDFIVVHEISHILRDQIRFYRSRPRNFFLEGDESGRPQDPEDDFMLLQLLEVDADLAAAPETARQFARGQDNPPMWQEWTDDKFEVLNLWLVSLSLTFFLLDAWARKSGNSKTHPEPRVRLSMIIAALAEQFSEWELVHTAEEGVEFAMYAYQQAVEIWLGLGLPPESSLTGTPEEWRAGASYYNRMLTEYGIRFQRP